jgi:hypothetical protein
MRTHSNATAKEAKKAKKGGRGSTAPRLPGVTSLVSRPPSLQHCVFWFLLAVLSSFAWRLA